MRSRAVSVVVLFIATTSACGGPPRFTTPTTPPPTEPPVTIAPPDHPPPPPLPSCGGSKLRVAFYNAGQALAALVMLPDGKHILVDAGESATRPGCGAPCKAWHERVIAGLARDLGDAPIDMLWITHPHSDHIGGAVDVLTKFTVASYVDNGRDLTGTTDKKTRDAVAAHQVPVTVIEPGSATVPLASSEDLKLTAIVPSEWLAKCTTNANVCSIALRIDCCASSIHGRR